METRLKRGMAMRSVKVDRDDLLKRLRENLDRHMADYREAVDDYRKAAVAALAAKRAEFEAAFEKLVARFGSGESPSLGLGVSTSFDLSPPESHEKDYRQIIEMVAMSVDPVIELESDEFQCYVMDDWAWKAKFVATNSLYKSRLGG